MEITDRVAFNALQAAGHLPQEIQTWLRKRQQAGLRDRFAMNVLQGLLACALDYEGANGRKARCSMAYKYADNMLEERAK